MLNPEEPPSTIMDAVESGMPKSEAVWVNLIATRCRAGRRKNRGPMICKTLPSVYPPYMQKAYK
jgi:hypothetical protein